MVPVFIRMGIRLFTDILILIFVKFEILYWFQKFNSTSSYHALVSRSNHGPDMSTPRSRQSPSSHYHRLMAASSDTGSDFGSCESYHAWAL